MKKKYSRHTMKFIKNYFGANTIKYISVRIIVIPHHAIFNNI